MFSWPQPKKLKQLRGNVGLTDYYRITQEKQFSLGGGGGGGRGGGGGGAATTTFEKLKKSMTERPPCFAFRNFPRPL